MKLDKYFRPKINRKIIKFFAENPSSVDTARGIATWINEDMAATEKALDELVKAGVLTAHGTGAMSAYGYTTDARFIKKIKSFIMRKNISE